MYLVYLVLNANIILSKLDCFPLKASYFAVTTTDPQALKIARLDSKS